MDNQSPSIIQNGTALQGNWDRSFEASVLDQGVAYPAAMAALPTSTPNPGTLRRKSRRSWFETTPKGVKLEIAVEKPEIKKKPQSRNTEVLTLTHFTAAPRLDFETLKPGQQRVCTLLIRNPHDYEQKVKVEKVPEKKHFSVPCKEFVVGASESYPFEITWSPVEPGNFREMLLMQVDSAYRVQAYVLGKVVEPPAKKKRVRKTGLLAHKATAPFSVIHTTSLANINHEYSPEKKPKTNTTQAPAKTTKTKKPEMNPGNRRRSSGKVRRSPRQSTGQKVVNKEKEVCVTICANDENMQPSVDTVCEHAVDHKEQTQTVPNPVVEEKNLRKKMRRSNTYSNVSGLGLTVPIIHGETVKGHADTSLLNLTECNVSGVKPIEDSMDFGAEFTKPNKVADLPSFMASNNALQKSANNITPEASFLKGEEQIIKENIQKTEAKPVLTSNEPSSFPEKNMPCGGAGEPSFLSTPVNKVLGGDKGNPRVALLKTNNESFQDSLEIVTGAKTTNLDELPSFLAEVDENTKPSKPRRSARKKSGKFTDENDLSAEKKLLRSLKRRSSNKRSVSPDTFLRETRSSARNAIDVNESIHKPLNDSVGSSSILEQLRNIKSFIHEKSVEIDESANESGLVEGISAVVEPECKKTRSSPRFAAPDVDMNLRRGTFVTKPENLKMIETQKPSEASPRRTTFTVIKKTDRVKLPARSRSEGSPCTTRSAAQMLRHNTLKLDTLEEGNSHEVSEPKIEQETYVSRGSEAAVRKSDAKPERLYSADSLENDSAEEQFGSPKMIPEEENSDAFGRRATLTVTKSRPSDALMEHVKKNGARPLFDDSIVGTHAENRKIKGIPEVIENDTVDEGSASLKKSVQNSTFEVSKDKSGVNSSFPTTPHQLPNSPDPNLSRRSTHVVEKPRVLELSRADRKQLFVPEKSNYVELEEEHEIPNTNKNLEDVEEKENDPAVDNEQIEEEIDVSVEIQCPLENDSPSLNTRRRLSARRSLDKKDESKEVTEPDKEVIEPDTKDKEQKGLFFVALDESSEKAAPVRKTVRKDPQHFLKKRSNPVQHTEDIKAKRIRSEPVVVKEKPAVVTGRAQSRPAGRELQSKTVNVTKTQAQQRPTRTAGAGGNNGRNVLKPKANVMAKGLAQSKLILVKKSKTALAKHPLPFAAKNMYYDERWMEKQERGFVNWLNFILTPAEEYQGNNVKVKVDAGKLVVDDARGKVKLAPTNEVLSFRAYSAHRKLNRLRRAACRLFQSDAVIRVVQKIEAEVEGRRLLVRKDKMLHADIGAKQKILDLLLSYNPLWLRVGLETIYGEVVPLQSNTDVYGLSRFILTRMLYSPDIALQFSHPTVPNLYRDGYAEATAQHTLKKFLMLVYFLERAKLDRLIEHNPCLFCKDSEAKTSKDLLLQFSRNYLSGEGDITRHLGYLGYKVSYTQTALDEFDFAVSTLSTDLRDGLRLSRVLELLCEKPDLSKGLRCPAISRLQKIHNVEAAFKVLSSQGVETAGVTARDIVDGHREKTLKLLWTIILQYQVAVLLDEAQLRQEVELLQRSLKLKSQLHALQNYRLDKSRRDSTDSDLHTKNEKLDLLLKWCRCVCAFYNIKIENFTVSFSDGRALCHILHYYHPGLLPLAEIHRDTVMTHMESMEKNARQNLSTSLNDSVNSSAVFGDIDDPELMERLQKNERENFKVLFEKVKELGGVPLMLKWSDMSGTIPDEKVVVTYLLYLCARLLDIRHESRAARVIQMAWRRHRLGKMKEELKVKNKAASVIQSAVRKFLGKQREVRRACAAVTIQRVWRGHCGRTQARLRRQELAMLKQQEVVIVLQSHIRGYLERRQFLQKLALVVKLQQRVRAVLTARQQRQDFLQTRQAACTIQATWRMYTQRCSYHSGRRAVVLAQAVVRRFLAVRKYGKLRQAVVNMQRRYRCKCVTKHCRQEFLKMKKSVISVQAAVRGYILRRKLKQKHAAATVLQSAVRGHLERSSFHKAKHAVVLCQRRYRAKLEMKKCRDQFLTVKRLVVALQSAYRGFKVRQELQKKHTAASKIKAFVRGCLQQKRYLKQRWAAIVFQKRYRSRLLGQQCRQEFLIKKGAAITIEATFRAYRQQKQYKCIRAAAITLQASIRSALERQRFLAVRRAVVACQRMYRQKVEAECCRQLFLVSKGAAITIQATFRGYMVRKDMKQRHMAATAIQAHVRSYQARNHYLRLRQAVVLVQRRYRLKQTGARCRKEYLAARASAVAIQAVVRGYLVRQDMKKKHAAATVIQAGVKGRQQRRQYLRLKQAAVFCQRCYRNRVHGQQCRKQFLVIKAAAITLQAAYRGFRERKKFRQKLAAVTSVQAQVRGYLERKRYQKVQQSAVTVQRVFRAKLEGEKTRRQFLIMKGAALVIQAAVRGHIVRQDMRRKHAAAVRIQALVKGRQERQKYLRLKQAALVCQRRYRSKVLGEECRKQFLITKSAAITLQAAYRGFRVRKDFGHTLEAATKVQALIRGYLGRKRYQKMRASAIVVQRIFRAKLEGERTRRQFLIMKGAALVIQAAVRGHIVRQNMRRKHAAAVRIQALVKGRQERQKYLRLKQAALVCQTRYRSKVLGEECRKQFLITKSAAVTLQAAYRGFRERKDFSKKLEAATKVQSLIRGYLERKRYQKMRSSAVVLQRVARAKIEGEKTRRQFLIMKGAALVVQAAVRGHIVRQDMRRKHAAAVRIQALVKGRQERQKYLRLKQAALVCQTRYRSKVLGEECRKQFLITKSAAITLQAAYRGFRVRKDFGHTLEAATKVQALIRGYLERKRYQKMRASAIVVQRIFRAKLEGEKTRRQFLIMKGAALVIQAAVRGHIVRQDMRRKHAAAVRIQALVKGRQERQKYLRLKQAALVCQTRYRSKVLGEECRKNFMITKGAAITIQANVRSFIVRKGFMHKLRALTKIQAQFRGYLERKRYQKLKQSVMIIQMLFRAKLKGEETRRHFLIMKGAAITVQAAVRGHLARRVLKRHHRSATVIQSNVRGFLCRCRYLRLRSAAVCCQRLYRSKCEARRCKEQYRADRAAVVTVQSAVRGFLVRRQMLHKNKAAVVVQSHVRAFIERRHFLRLKNVTISCQRLVRNNMESRRCRREFLITKGAAIVMQAAYRGYKARREIQQKHTAASVIQAEVRSWLARQRYMKIRHAAIVCQRRYRAQTEGRKCQQQYLKLQAAVIMLQSAFRGLAVRRQLSQEHQAATKVQAIVRCHLQRSRYLKLRQAAVLCQRLYRSKLFGRQVREQYEETRQAAVTVQAAYRGYTVRREQRLRQRAATVVQTVFRAHTLRTRFLKLKQAAAVCQKSYRSKLEAQRCRTQFLICKGAAITVQACIRGFLIRQQMKQKRRAATKVQAMVRAYLSRKRFLKLRQTAVICQRRHQANLKMKKCQQQYQRLKTAAVTLQAVSRGYLARKEFCHKRGAATLIQSQVKCYLQRQKYQKLKKMAIFCQRHFRAKLQGEKCRQEFYHTKAAVVRLQAAYRGLRVRREVRRRHAAATVIQTVIRGYFARRRYLALKWAAMACQLRFRQKQRGRHVQRFTRAAQVNMAAVRIQRCYRNYRVMRLGEERLHSVIVIQNWMRSKLQRVRYLRDCQRVVMLQSHVRSWLCRRHKAACVIQRAARVWLGSMGQRKARRSATKIQALWRGHVVRKNSKSKKLAAARHRVQKATAEATEDQKLGNRTASALDFLLKFKQLSMVFDALVHLEVATRLSWVCCERLVEANAVAVLYRLMRSCNRSLPHMEIIKYTVCIMLNVAKYEATRPHLCKVEDGVSTLVELMTIYREKKGPIFTKICNLLGIMALDDHCKTKILKDKSLKDKLQSIHSLTLRKNKMEETQRATRARMNATMNTTFLISSPVKRHSIKPEWSLHKDRMNEIENPLKAINFVLSMLGLPTKTGR